jgi:ribosomal protein S12 methylthiotransferase accessory factor
MAWFELDRDIFVCTLKRQHLRMDFPRTQPCQLYTYVTAVEFDMEYTFDRESESGTIKGYRNGTDRLVSPAETLERIRPFFAKVGLTRIANVTGLDIVDVPVVMTVRPNSRSLAVHQGKGLTLEAAKASAAMESLERWHAEQLTVPLRLGTVAEMRETGTVLDLSYYSWFREIDGLGEERRFLWLEGRELVHDTPIWVPYDLVRMDFRSDGFDQFGPDLLPPWINSNGLASGNHPTEALVHALCELIERDALVKLDHDFLSRPESRINLETVDDPNCREILARFRNANLSVAVWDITSNIRIPTFECLIGEDPAGAYMPLPLDSGQGSHLRREVALSRALTEAAQVRLTGISGMRDDMSRPDYEYRRDKLTLTSWWKLLKDSKGMRDFRDVPTYSHASFEDDAAELFDALLEEGIGQIALVDLTRADMGIPVMKVIVPELLFP